MTLMRLVGFTALTCGLALAAEQQPVQKNHFSGPLGISETSPNSLPGPLSSAIQRLASGERVQQVRPKLYHSERSALMARAEKSLAPCSIPFSHGSSAGERFFIREVPIPESSTRMDGMPIIHGPVCGESAESRAH
ncbi:MAG TPA: hypothetical protein VGE93_08660 [Bryobacteraceae bacterium]